MAVRPHIYARVDPALRDRVKAEADLRFEGNESVVVRVAVVTYLRLREHLGSSFDETIEQIAPVATAVDENAA